MSMGRGTPIPVLALLALVLLGAAPSVGDRIAGAAGPSIAPEPVAVAACGDDRAVLVASGAGAEGAVFRCVDGVPLPRQGPWSTPGCSAPPYLGEVTLLGANGRPWREATACYVETTPGRQSPATVTGLGR